MLRASLFLPVPGRSHSDRSFQDKTAELLKALKAEPFAPDCPVANNDEKTYLKTLRSLASMIRRLFTT
jgi:hypothetical protein